MSCTWVDWQCAAVSKYLLVSFCKSKLTTDHCGGTLTYTHKKLWLFILINNNEVAVSSTPKLAQCLELPHFKLGAIFEDLTKQPINSAIWSLYGTNFSHWKLRALLNETWVGEDVLNGLSELLYFCQPLASFAVIQWSTKSCRAWSQNVWGCCPDHKGMLGSKCCSTKLKATSHSCHCHHCHDLGVQLVPNKSFPGWS